MYRLKVTTGILLTCQYFLVYISFPLLTFFVQLVQLVGNGLPMVSNPKLTGVTNNHGPKSR